MKKAFFLFFVLLRFAISGQEQDMSSRRLVDNWRDKCLCEINVLSSARRGSLSQKQVGDLRSLALGMHRLFEKADFKVGQAVPLSYEICHIFLGFCSQKEFAQSFLEFFGNSDFLRQILFKSDETVACDAFLNGIIPEQPFFFKVPDLEFYNGFVIKWNQIFKEKFDNLGTMVGMFHLFETFLFLQVHFLYLPKPFHDLLNMQAMNLFLNTVKDLPEFYLQPFLNSFQGDYAFFQIWDGLDGLREVSCDLNFPSEGPLVERIRFLQFLFCLRQSPDLLNDLHSVDLDRKMENLNPSYGQILKFFFRLSLDEML